MCDAHARVLTYYQVNRVADGCALLAALCEMVVDPVAFSHRGEPYSEYDPAEWGDWKDAAHHDQRGRFRSIIPPTVRGMRHASVGEMDLMLGSIMRQSLGDAYVTVAVMEDFVTNFDQPGYTTIVQRERLHARLVIASRGIHFIVTAFQYQALRPSESFTWPGEDSPSDVTEGWRWALVLFNVHSGKFSVIDGYETLAFNQPGAQSSSTATILLDFMRREPQFPLATYVRAYELIDVTHIPTSCPPEEDCLSGDFCAYALGSALLTLNQRSRLFKRV